jgi:predicted dehydrogenase
MKQLKVGIIGVGMGKHHLRAFQKHPRSQVTAVADLDEDRLKQVAEEHGVPAAYTTAEAMLAAEELDVAVVATPNKFHKPLTIAALEAGCHVLCEKPMAMNAAEAREMQQAARRTGKRLMINFSFRFTPEAWHLKREVDAGTLGDIYYGETRWLRRRGMPGFGGWFGQKALSGGGPLIDLGVHRLDLALWLMGYPEPAWVLAATHNLMGSRLAEQNGKLFDVEDIAAALIRFKNGATLYVAASWASHIKERELMETRMVGTEGGLVHHNDDEGYHFACELYTDRHGAHVDLTPHGRPPAPASPMEHFGDCILDDRPHTATAAEGVTVMEVIDAIYASAAQGAPVAVGAADSALAG